jgi:hypothetical protein
VIATDNVGPLRGALSSSIGALRLDLGDLVVASAQWAVDGANCNAVQIGSTP